MSCDWRIVQKFASGATGCHLQFATVILRSFVECDIRSLSSPVLQALSLPFAKAVSDLNRGNTNYHCQLRVESLEVLTTLETGRYWERVAPGKLSLMPIRVDRYDFTGLV